MATTRDYVESKHAEAIAYVDGAIGEVAGGAHPTLAAHDLLGLATQAELDSHVHPGPATLKTTSDQIVNGTAFRDITGLTFSVLANTDYAFSFYIAFRSAALTTGFRFGVNGPAGAVVDYVCRYQTVANSAAAGVATYLDQHNVSYDSMTVLTAAIAVGVDLYAKIEGRIKVGATAGTFAARAASELATDDIVIQKGSWGMYF